MPDLVEDIEIYPRMVALAGELERTFKARGIPLDQSLVLPEGLPAHDFVGQDCQGSTWVRLVRVYPYGQAFPQQDVTSATCLSLLAYELEIGYAHCAPDLPSDGSAPSSEDQLQAARVQASAMTAMWQSVKALFEDGEYEDMPYLLGQYIADLNLGGVLGATWTLTVGDRRG